MAQGRERPVVQTRKTLAMHPLGFICIIPYLDGLGWLDLSI